MPPWGAVKGFGSFRNDQGLTQEDLELISDWVEGGAPEGNPLLLPALPAFDPPKPSRQGREVLVDGSLQFSGPVTLLGLQPKTVQEGKTVQIVAERPDGTVEPLLWLYHYKPQFDHPYLLLRPLTLPAGSKIVCQPPDAGTVSLLTRVTSAHSRAH